MSTVNAAPNSKGDPWIIAELEQVRRRNAFGDNPNMERGRMVYDFDAGKVRVEGAKE